MKNAQAFGKARGRLRVVAHIFDAPAGKVQRPGIAALIAKRVEQRHAALKQIQGPRRLALRRGGLALVRHCPCLAALVAQLLVQLDAGRKALLGARGLALRQRGLALVGQRPAHAVAVAQPPKQLQTAGEQRLGAAKLAQRLQGLALHSQRDGQPAPVAQRFEQRQAGGHQLGGALVLALRLHHLAIAHQHRRAAFPVAQLLEQRQALREMRCRLRVVALCLGHLAQVVKRAGAAGCVAQRGAQALAFFQQRARLAPVVLRPGQPPRAVEQPRPRRICRGVTFEQRGNGCAPFANVPAHQPELPQRLGQPHAQRQVAARRAAPRQRGAQVVVLGFQALQPLLLLLVEQVGARGLGQRKKDRGVALARGGQLASALQQLERILADRFEHQHAPAAVGIRVLKQAAANQRGQRRKHLGGRQVGGQRLGCFQRAAAHARAQRAKQALLGRAKQIVAPGDGVAQGLLAGRQIARAAGQHVQGLRAAQAGQQGGWRQQPGPRGGQLDRQRQAIQPRADLGNHRGIFRREREVGAHRLRACHKQRHCRVGGQRLGRGGAWRGQGQRRHGQLVLARKMQRDPARHQRAQVRALRQQRGHQRRGTHNLLEVIEHQQQRFIAQRVLKQLGVRRAALHIQPQRLGNRRANLPGQGQGRQRHKAHAVAEIGRQLARDRQAEPGFARAARPRQRQQAHAVVAQARPRRSKLGLAPDQRVGRDGQRVDALGRHAAPGREEFGALAGGDAQPFG